MPSIDFKEDENYPVITEDTHPIVVNNTNSIEDETVNLLTTETFTINDNETINYAPIVINNDTNDDNYSEESYINPLEINAYEQIKLFLTTAKNFFTSNLIETVAKIVLSTNTMKSTSLQHTASDIIISFAKVCNSIHSIEEEYGELLPNSIIDNLIVKVLTNYSEDIMNDNIGYSSYTVREKFEETVNTPEFFSDISANDFLKQNIENLYNANIVIDQNTANNIQHELDSKNKIIKIVKSIRDYAKFISRDASQCSNMNEFLDSFVNIINDTSLNLSEVTEHDDDGVTLSEMLKDSFYGTVIRDSETHVKCGITAFDSITNGGFESDRIYLLSGKTGGGKSTVLLNIAYGMYKYGNGMILPEMQIFDKLAEGDHMIDRFKEYCMANIKRRIDKEIENGNTDAANKKHMILYVTLENTEYETLKRFMCRMGLISNVVWTLIERDKELSKLVKTYGFKFKADVLPKNMDTDLKRRLSAISAYVNTLDSIGHTEFKVWWKPPHTITAYDIFMECKRIERSGYKLDAVFIDYPDKMKPINGSKGDQSWDSLGKIIDNLKGLAKQLHTPIIGVSQLTRQSNKDSGNKNVVIKGGSTAGSQQKESNTDTLINMNIFSKDDTELGNKVNLFKRYQQYINTSKSSMIKMIFDTNVNSNNLLALEAQQHKQDELTKQIEYSSDILQLSFSMPDIQTINNYIVKNRDGISDITFDTYIVYGIYMVTDHDNEAINAAKYSVDTYSKFINYMHKNNLIDNEGLQVSKGMISFFDEKMANFKQEIIEKSFIPNGAMNGVKHNDQSFNNSNGGFITSQQPMFTPPPNPIESNINPEDFLDEIPF